MAFKTRINEVEYDAEIVTTKSERSYDVELKEVGSGFTIAKISFKPDTSFPVLGRYEFYVNMSSDNAYLANQLVSNNLAVLVSKKKHIRNNIIYLVYRLMR